MASYSGQTSQIFTFLFTDLESSTRLWEQFPQSMKAALERHDALLKASVEGSKGRVVKTTGDGLMAVFSSTPDGVNACLEAQWGLLNEPWEETGPLRVRIGLHTGEAQPRGGDYFGPAVNRTARLMSVAHGGQVLLSSAADSLVIGQLPEGTEGFVRLMTHRAVLVSPMSPTAAVGYVRQWFERPNVERIEPGPVHLEVLERLLYAVGTAGNLRTDAHLAALAIEHRCELHSNDADFSRFPGLRWRNPLGSSG